MDVAGESVRIEYESKFLGRDYESWYEYDDSNRPVKWHDTLGHTASVEYGKNGLLCHTKGCINLTMTGIGMNSQSTPVLFSDTDDRWNIPMGSSRVIGRCENGTVTFDDVVRMTRPGRVFLCMSTTVTAHGKSMPASVTVMKKSFTPCLLLIMACKILHTSGKNGLNITHAVKWFTD